MEDKNPHIGGMTDKEFKMWKQRHANANKPIDESVHIIEAENNYLEDVEIPKLIDRRSFSERLEDMRNSLKYWVK